MKQKKQNTLEMKTSRDTDRQQEQGTTQQQKWLTKWHYQMLFINDLVRGLSSNQKLQDDFCFEDTGSKR